MRKGFFVLIAIVVVSIICGIPLTGFSQTLKDVPIQEDIALGQSDAPYTLGISDVIDIQVRNQPETGAV